MKYTWILCLIFLLGVSVGAMAKDSEEKQEKKEKRRSRKYGMESGRYSVYESERI